MKIFYSLPENMDKGDVYILGIVRVGVLGFLAISSLTVFGGFKSYSSDYMDSLYPALAWLLLFFGYWAFCFVPDFVNTMIVRYISRTILKRTFIGDPRTIVVLLFSLGLVFFLTRYSYKMSQFSAAKTGRDMGGEIERTDLFAFDSTYQLRFDKLQSDFEKEKAEVISRYEQQMADAAGELDFKIKGEETLMAGLEKNRKKTNTIWTDQQIRLHQRRIADYQKRRKPIVSPIRAAQQKELDALNEKIEGKNALLAESFTVTKRTTIQNEEAAGDTHQAEVSFFSKQLSGIAGNAVFFLLMLTIVREIIYDRNDIDPDPVFSPFDFQPSVALEVIAYPCTRIGRSIVNYVRQGYNELPDLIQRDDYKELTDPGQRQKVRKAKNSETEKSGKAKSSETKSSETEAAAEGKTSETEKVKTSETEPDKISEVLEDPKTTELRKSEKAEDSSKDKSPSRKPVSVMDDSKTPEITEIEHGKDGKVLKVRIGYKWYNYYELGKRIYDFRAAIEKATKESTRLRNWHKVALFQEARKLFENAETSETKKNGKATKEMPASHHKL